MALLVYVVSAAQSVVLFAGDSAIRFQYYLARGGALFSSPVHFVEIASGVHLPSACPNQTMDSWKLMQGRLHLPSELAHVVYTNFGIMHLLHLHPARPWWYKAPPQTCQSALKVREYGNWSKGQVAWVADYAGYAGLEQLIDRELASYSRMAHEVIVMLPNYVCDGSFTGDYAHYTTGAGREDGLRMCAEYIAAKQASSGWPVLPAGRDAYKWCQEGQLSSQGSLALESRMRAAVAASAARLGIAVQIVEATRLTDGQCNETHDGRHYSERLVRMQLGALQQLITNRTLVRTPSR